VRVRFDLLDEWLQYFGGWHRDSREIGTTIASNRSQLGYTLRARGLPFAFLAPMIRKRGGYAELQRLHRDVLILIEDDRAIALVLELVREPCAKALDQSRTAVEEHRNLSWLRLLPIDPYRAAASGLAVMYAGAPHFRVSCSLPTPSVAAAVSKIMRRMAMSLGRIFGGYALNFAATAGS